MSLLIIFGSAALISFWMFYPYQPFTFHSDTSEVSTTTPFVAGDYVIWNNNFKHNTVGDLVTVNKRLIDGTVIAYPTTQYLTDGKEVAEKNALMKLPAYISSGTYHIEIVYTVKVNPIRTVSILRKTNAFKIYGVHHNSN